MLSRRNLITLSASLATSVALGVGFKAYTWWDNTPNLPHKNLSTEEATFIRSLAGAAFPAGSASKLSVKHANLDRFFDLFIENIEGQNQNLLRFFLHTLNHISLINQQTLFIHLSPAKKIEELEWFSTRLSRR